MKKIATLLTNNELELPCVILSEKTLSKGREVLAYAQNRLVKGYMEDDELLVEFEIIAEFAIIPELEELIKEEKCTEF